MSDNAISATATSYQDTIKERGYGFHHCAVGVRDFDTEVGLHQARGCEIALSDLPPRGVRIAYLDAGQDLPELIELIELADALEDMYLGMQQASADWDGADPIRDARTGKPIW